MLCPLSVRSLFAPALFSLAFRSLLSLGHSSALSWALLDTSGDLLGCSWMPLRAFLGPLGCLLGASWGPWPPETTPRPPQDRPGPTKTAQTPPQDHARTAQDRRKSDQRCSQSVLFIKNRDVHETIEKQTNNIWFCKSWLLLTAL